MPDITAAQRQDSINVGGGRNAWGDTMDAARSQAMGAAASQRAAYQADTTYNDAARNSQNTALTYMARAMSGQEPSRAEIAGRQALDQSLNYQLAGAASARGGALGQAAAMRQAQINAGYQQAQGLQTLAANRAAEMAQARQDYGQMATAMRGNELQNMGQMSQNELAQRQLNQQAQMGYEQMGQTSNIQQAQTDLGVAGINANNWQSWQNQQQIQAGEDRRLKEQIKAQKEAQQQQMIMAAIGGGASIGAAALTGGGSVAAQAGAQVAQQAASGGGGGGGVPPPRADGGPVNAGKPYLVGERGPELVVPKQDGHVIPAEQTQQIVPLMDTSEGMLQATPEGRAYYKPRLEVPPVHPAFAPSTVVVAKPTMGEAAAKRSKAAPSQQKMSPGELMHQAELMQQQMQAEHEARMSQGPAARRLANGTDQSGYTTELTPGAERAYQDWRQRTAPWDTGEDYDLRGAFADGTDRDGRGHLPDTYKKPNHETFSNESQYAQYEPESAGYWDGDRYVAQGPPRWLRQAVFAPQTLMVRP